ncbi:MAG: peptidoglycan-binding protein [Actinomycetota bacterium]
MERRDLVSREQWDGTLGYADPRTLPSTLSGTVTWLPAEGSSIPRGGRLYRVDDQSVRLLYGRLPAWRSMSDGTQGADVEQLERNLAALGFTDGGEMDVDGDFDADTADAVENWQEDIGATEDGVVDLGEVVFLEGRRRAGAHETSVGSGIAPGTPVMTTTSTEQVVTVDLDATQQELARESDAVTVELPDGTVLRGRIDTVSSVAETDPEAEEGADPTVEVTVSLRERGPGGLDQAPVEVGLAVDVARDVLAVPVEALLALAEGGYAVEVAEGSTTRLVGVETGLYADGWVEISGQGLEDGTAVVVAR